MMQPASALSRFLTDILKPMPSPSSTTSSKAGRLTTLVAALRHDEITAPCVFDGPMDGASFLTYVEHFLALALRQGDVVVMDNLASHKVAGVRQAIERAGATLRYLPAYGPDLNPIEQAFAKLKAALRKAAARTFDTLVKAIAQALADFTVEERTNYTNRPRT
jgi:transposase